jgi:hypothetical protein
MVHHFLPERLRIPRRCLGPASPGGIMIDIANLDKFETGQVVIARFTNCHRYHEFRGEVVGKTKNYWKVKSLESVYEGEAPGRVFHIETLESRKYSQNNCIVRVA